MVSDQLTEITRNFLKRLMGRAKDQHTFAPKDCFDDQPRELTRLAGSRCRLNQANAALRRKLDRTCGREGCLAALFVRRTCSLVEGLNAMRPVAPRIVADRSDLWALASAPVRLLRIF